MITIQYKTCNTHHWMTRSFPDAACFENWKYTFNKVVTHYTAVSNHRVIEKKRPKPFYWVVLQWLF